MKWLILLMLGILMISIVNADLGTFKQNDCVNIITNLNATNVNISQIISPSPSSTILVNNKRMTNLGGGAFNYTFCQTGKLGRYTYGYCDYDGNCYSNDFTVTSIGEQNDKGITEFVGILAIAIIVALFIYLRTSRLLGSLIIFVTGFGILFRNSLYGWLGWTVIASGFLMMILSLMTPKKVRRRF